MQNDQPRKTSKMLLWHNSSFWYLSVNSTNSMRWPDYVCDPTPHQTKRNGAIISRVEADAAIVPFNPAVALRYLPDVRRLRDLDPVAGQPNQPLDHFAPVVPRRREDDDVAAGELVALEAGPLHQRVFTCLSLEGGVHGGAMDGGQVGVAVGDGDADEGAGDAGLHIRPERPQHPRHVQDSAVLLGLACPPLRRSCSARPQRCGGGGGGEGGSGFKRRVVLCYEEKKIGRAHV